MNPAALYYALQVLQAIPTLIAAGQNISGLVSQSTTALNAMIAEKRNPSDAEWDALNAAIKALRDQLHAG